MVECQLAQTRAQTRSGRVGIEVGQKEIDEKGISVVPTSSILDLYADKLPSTP